MSQASDEILLQLCRDVFGIPDLGLEDDFASQGLSSLLIVCLQVELEDSTGLEIALDRLLEADSVSSLGTIIRQLHDERG